MTLSRRSFVKGGAVAAFASLGTVAMAGCQPASSTTGAKEEPQALAQGNPSFFQAPEPVAEDSITQTIDADVVVVGAGVAGMCAARGATEKGAKVVVIEKATGFQTRGGGGSQLGAVNCSAQKQAGITLDGVQIVNSLMEAMGQYPSQEHLKYWADHSAEDFDWFLELCPKVEFMAIDSRNEQKDLPEDGTVYVSPMGDQKHKDGDEYRYPEFHTAMSINFDPKDGLTIPLQTFESYVIEQGGQFLYSTWARYFEKDGERVSGVIAEDMDGNFIRVNAAKAVISCCGDISNDPEMMEYYVGADDWGKGYSTVDAKGNIANTGDGHKMCLWAGAAMEHAPFAPMAHGFADCTNIYVDETGKRVVNEELGAQEFSNWLHSRPGRPVYAIKGNAQPKDMRGNDVPTFETAAALADELGIDAATLQETIDAYNDYCAAGVDFDFGKGAHFLKAVEAPFGYEECSLPGMLVCTGGIDNNINCQALDAEGNVVPGLYVAGNNQGRRFNCAYPMAAPAISHGTCMSLGRHAGHMAAELG